MYPHDSDSSTDSDEDHEEKGNDKQTFKTSNGQIKFEDTRTESDDQKMHINMIVVWRSTDL